MSSLDIHAGGKETRLPDDFRWPDGKRIAVFPRVSFEWWSDDKWPGIGPMGNPLKARRARPERRRLGGIRTPARHVSDSRGL